MSSSSFRRRDKSPPQRPSRLRMDRQPAVARITDPSLPAGKRREIDNVMKKARASTNDYWDKKLLEVEEKDPHRWRHTGYKKMYIEGDSSSPESVRDGNFRYNNTGGLNGRGNFNRSRSPRSRSRSRPPMSPPRHRSPIPEHLRRVSPDSRRLRSPPDGRRIPPRSPPDNLNRRPVGARPRSPPEPHSGRRSPMNVRRRSPSPIPVNRRRSPPTSSVTTNNRGQILPRSKRPPSPPPRSRGCLSQSNSSISSCTDDSCSVCSPSHRHQRSRSGSRTRTRPGPRSPPPKHTVGGRAPPQTRPIHRPSNSSVPSSSSRLHPTSPPIRPEKYRDEKVLPRTSHEIGSRELIADRAPPEPGAKVSRASRHSSEDVRSKARTSETATSTSGTSKKKKDKSAVKLRTRIKIEGEKRKKQGTSSESEDSESDSEGSLPTFTATTRLTLSERFGKMAQWSIDRSNMENMRITKDSTGGALKVMIEEGLESPPRRYSYSPAPVGHFPEELATTAPTGMMSWDDVRVRYEYYKSRGYLRDLDLKDYVKWEEWWYKYQEWLKQERYYEFYERQQMQRRRRKKIPIAQRLN